MSNSRQLRYRALLLLLALLIVITISARMRADTGTCGVSITLPFTDVPSTNIFFCSIAEAYFSGLTNGTSSTTYNPSDPVPREQMAAFITRTQDSALRRGSRRAALNQWSTPASTGALRSVDLNDNSFAQDIVCDGEDLWLSMFDGVVKRVHASDGKVLQTWAGATNAQGLVVAAGRIFIAETNGSAPGRISVIDPAATPGAVTVFESNIGPGPNQITFDGANLWTSNFASTGSISRVDVGTGIDSTFTTGFAGPWDILWDGANLWVLDNADSHLKRVDTSAASVLENIPVVPSPQRLLFDGTNIWVSGIGTTSNNITIVRAVGSLRGTVLATLSAGQAPFGMAFDGQRVLSCDYNGHLIFLFNATDFTTLGTVSTGAVTRPRYACSDGVNFWISTEAHAMLQF